MRGAAEFNRVDLNLFKRVQDITLAHATTRRTLTNVNDRLINPLTLGKQELAPEIHAAAKTAALGLQRDVISRLFVLPDLPAKVLLYANEALDRTQELGAFGLTNIGARPAQEDRIELFAHDGKKYFLLADGMHQAGGIASATAVKKLREAIVGGNKLEDAVQSLNQEIVAKQAELGQGEKPMGTTILAVEIDGARLNGFYIGNSLAQIFGQEQSFLLTRPHVSQVKIEDAARRQLGITEDEVQEVLEGPAPFFHTRVIDAFIASATEQSTIVYALGVQLPPEGKFAKFSYNLAPGDRVLLNSDGLCLSVEESRPIVTKKDATLRETAEELLARCLSKKQEQGIGPDNISFILIEQPNPNEAATRMVDLPPAEPERGEGTTMRTIEAEHLLAQELARRQQAEARSAVLAHFRSLVKTFEENRDRIAGVLDEAHADEVMLDFEVRTTEELIAKAKTKLGDLQRRYEITCEQIEARYSQLPEGESPFSATKLDELQQRLAAATRPKNIEAIKRMITEHEKMVADFAESRQKTKGRELARAKAVYEADSAQPKLGVAALESENLTTARRQLQQVRDNITQLTAQSETLIADFRAQKALFDEFFSGAESLAQAFQRLETSIGKIE
jgi:serine/threonine protein phosphatase PrpC